MESNHIDIQLQTTQQSTDDSANNKKLSLNFMNTDVLCYSSEIINQPAAITNLKFDATFKLIMIGDSGVGKTCIINRIGNNTFNKDHEVTLGAEFTTIATQINKKSFLKFQFWDSCGQERYNSITRIFYRGSQCVFLVYDVTNAQSLRNLESVWIDDLHSNLKDAQIVLVGNKIDIDNDSKLSYKRQVTQDEGATFMQKHKLNYFTEVSAKSGHGVKELVEYISKVLYHEHKKKLDEFKVSETGSVGSSYKSQNSNSLPGQSPLSGYSQQGNSPRNRAQGANNSGKRLQAQAKKPQKNGCC